MGPKSKRTVKDDTIKNLPNKRPTIAHINLSDLNKVDTELSNINDLLQKEETSQKQTWQIGKRVKKLLESYGNLPIFQQLDAYFLWGTALTRLASLNEDSTLANAAADKFKQMLRLSSEDGPDATDAALGPVGFSLWGSSLLIVATETQSREDLDQALAKFQRAVEVDGGTTFETNFQLAKALKEGGDLMQYLENEQDERVKKSSYYEKALDVCRKLEKIYQKESQKEETRGKEDEDDDRVTTHDFAEAKLLEAVLQGLVEDSSSLDDFHRTIALYQKAIVLNPICAEALMEKTNYLAARCLSRTTLGNMLTFQECAKLFDNLETEYRMCLADIGFDLHQCHNICYRKGTHNQEELEEDEVDERVPHLLHTLGKGLAAFVRSFPQSEGDVGQQKKTQEQNCHEVVGNTRFAHAVEILRSAHHFHDKLGSYYLACLYASPGFEDETQCRMWLETADSYDALEDEFDVQEFITMHEKPWFKCFVQPPVQINEIDG